MTTIAQLSRRMTQPQTDPGHLARLALHDAWMVPAAKARESFEQAHNLLLEHRVADSMAAARRGVELLLQARGMEHPGSATFDGALSNANRAMDALGGGDLRGAADGFDLAAEGVANGLDVSA